jgi:hypothetical protein
VTGTCKLCRELVTGAPVLEVGPARMKAEFLAFAEAMRLHVSARHLDQVQVYGALITMLAQLFASLFGDCPLDDFKVGQDSVREFLCSQIRDAQVVISLERPVDSPLVVS